MLTNVSKTVNMKFHIGLNPSGGNCIFATDWWTGMLRLIGLFHNCFANVRKNPANIVFLKFHLETKDPPEVGLARSASKSK